MNDRFEIYSRLGISREVFELGEAVEEKLEKRFKAIDDTAEFNQLRVLEALHSQKIGEAALLGTTGYGYNDLGRDSLEAVYAHIFKTEDALVRPQISCGTQALHLALLSNLRPGDELLSISGKPYDTLEEVIGIRPSSGSLKEYGISYGQVELKEDGAFDFEAIRQNIRPNTKMVAVQRSKGYAERPTLSVENIGEAAKFVHGINPKIKVMVDNCYGEFVERVEPTEVGADIAVGSLIKNPGGGLAPEGGYIAGDRESVENAAYLLISPGLGKEVGASLGVLRNLYQGLFLSPTVTASALKAAIFAANIYEGLGFKTRPDANEERYDIIQAVTLNSPEALIAFCRGIQAASPIDSYVSPEPWAMPGYDSDVIMAAGNFISGSSIELSADGPLREPYTVYFQGGLTYPHARYGILNSLQYLINEGIIEKKAIV